MDTAGERGEGGPSNSSTMRKLEEGRRLPWRVVNYNTWIKLANKLDLPSPVSNNDWKGLAELLGFSTENILVLDNTKERSTISLFANYLPKKEATVNNVAKALKQMNRDDALQILLDAVPDIEAQYDAQKSSSEAMEGTNACVSAMAQGGCGCLGPSLSFASQHGDRGCSPCHSHPHPHPSSCGVASGGCCCHHVGSMHHYHHSPPPSCTPHLHSHAPHHHHAGRASPASGVCRVMAAVSNVPQQNYNVGPPTTPSHQDPPSFKPYGNSKGGGGGDFYASSSPSSSSSSSHHRGGGGGVRSPLLSQPRCSPLQHERMPSYSEVMQESMVVHHDQDSPHPADLRSFLAHHDDNGDMEVDGGGTEEPALIHMAIVRGQGLLSSMQFGLQGALPLDSSVTDVGEDNTTPSTSVEELSSSDSGSRLSALPLNVLRQVSEECNANQPLLPVAAAAAPSSPQARYDSGPHSLALWGGAEPSGDGRRNKHHLGIGGGGGRGCGSGGGGIGQREGQSSLKELESLSQLPSHFMPGNEFTTMVAEQQIEDVPPNGGGGGRGLQVRIKRERESSRSCQFSGLTGDGVRGGGGGGGGRPKGVAGADTYPMRIKPQPGGATMQEVRSRKPGVLMKTTSVPIDMKVEEFKKAFRHIKVFVTYANDSKQHCRQVLSLCNCLDRNGFSCCVDVSSQHDSPEQQQATRDWCSRKFKEADFVLVCLSPLYLQEISGVDSSHKTPPHPSNIKKEKNSLHTAHIYQIMQEESQTSRHCSRFVPLYMEGSGCGAGVGPSWLTRPLSYHWPRQYKDLLWMLTKPEDRIKLKSTATNNNSSSSRTSPQSSFSSSSPSQQQKKSGGGGVGVLKDKVDNGGGGGGGGRGRLCDHMVLSSPLS